LTLPVREHADVISRWAEPLVSPASLCRLMKAIGYFGSRLGRQIKLTARRQIPPAGFYYFFPEEGLTLNHAAKQPATPEGSSVFCVWLWPMKPGCARC